MFHLVILDLRLPQRSGLPAPEGLELGMALLEQCLNRDRFPIPSLLVISGHIGTTKQTPLQDALRDGFYHGRLLAKGSVDGLQTEIRDACKRAIRYCSVGIHIRDSGPMEFPTITPREDDLLRRAVLQSHGTCGLDLDWWSASRFGTLPGAVSGAPSWTKVLMGRYLLDAGCGASHPKFFKLLPASGAKEVIESLRFVEHKLSHIKISATIDSKSTALVVTEKVGSQIDRPKSLGEFLPAATPGQAREIATQISTQVRQLGDCLSDKCAVKELLWPHHKVDRLRKQWQALGGIELQRAAPTAIDPIVLYEELMSADATIRIQNQRVCHGDLHTSNVAVDEVNGNVSAYIFDPGVIGRDVAGRDLAVLEVSILLHQTIPDDLFVEVCALLYAWPVRTDDASPGDALGRNIVDSVQVLRSAAHTMNDPGIYALMVFDAALIQVGGLAVGPSSNRIRNPRAAAQHLLAVANWYSRMQPKRTGEASETG